MRQWTVDAFASEPFRGNPACVVEPFGAWPDAAWMQKLAAENNQAETAFLLAGEDPARFGLRWFTPTVEVPLCGHATLASGHVLLEGVNDAHIGRAEGWVRDGRAEGFVLIWPAADAQGQARIAAGFSPPAMRRRTRSRMSPASSASESAIDWPWQTRQRSSSIKACARASSFGSGS